MKDRRTPPVQDLPLRLAVRHFLMQDATIAQAEKLFLEIGDAKLRKLLTLHYLEGLSMVAIAFRLHYDLRTVQRHHRRALTLLALRLQHGRAQIEALDWNAYQTEYFRHSHAKRQSTQ